MMINWVYFSDTNIHLEDLKSLLEKQQFQLKIASQVEKLHNLLNDHNQTVLFIKAHTLYNEYDFCQEISVLYPHVYIILIVADNMENLKKAMLMGASDTIRSSHTMEELSETVDHAKKYMGHRAKMDQKYINLVKEKSKVIAVTNPKGGVGRTILTVNLAVALAKTGKKVAVIDGNLQFGEVAMYFNEKPKRTIYEWVKEAYGREHYAITQYMTTVEGDVSVLAAPHRPEFFEGISEDHMKEAIEAAKKLFDVVLIDMPANISEIHLRCLDLSDEILLLTRNEISVLRLTQLYLETLETIRLKDKVRLLLNRHVKGEGLELKKVEEILGLSVYHTLPEQGNVAASSIKSGQPLILSNSRSHLGKAIWHLSEKLFEHTKSDVLVEKKKEKRWSLIGR
ncbi:response regulator receiver protein [Neobacillus bataviensis LMG 21833]|uniref:Response regulator receiver protein n=1 Tax=Neobacillus bataviensis LMG 21833 TaxID=1117379 RepID=K6BUG3_9BACI|nr:AAA family ATPase [Neobacillus bataviensis]EKN62550.1 response regulator receiver protein [Neobacillus bataviensis LMG 21833]